MCFVYFCFRIYFVAFSYFVNEIRFHQIHPDSVAQAALCNCLFALEFFGELFGWKQGLRVEHQGA